MGKGSVGRAVARRRLGRLGEEVAAAFLRRRGAEVVARNLRCGRGEIDLVVRLSGRLAAIEVKTRHAGGPDPLINFTRAKADRVRQAARRCPLPVHRADLVTVTVGATGVDIRWVPFVA